VLAVAVAVLLTSPVADVQKAIHNSPTYFACAEPSYWGRPVRINLDRRYPTTSERAEVLAAVPSRIPKGKAVFPLPQIRRCPYLATA
jgi:hypothetical protein